MKGEEMIEADPEDGRFNSRARPVIAHYNYSLRFRSCGLCRGPGLCPVPIRAPPRYPAQDVSPLGTPSKEGHLPAPTDQGSALMTRAWLHIIINLLNH